MRYENWKELKPLTEHVPIWTKCVVISGYKSFYVGDVVITLEEKNATMCKDENGKQECMAYFELALLPSDTAEPEKQERKIVQIAALSDKEQSVVFALCDDGTAWVLHGTVNPIWAQLPRIPQDAV